MSELTDTLDQAIDRIRRGEDLEIILADYPPQANDLGPVLAAAMTLDVLRPVPTSVSNSLTNDRKLFLTELAQLSEPAVSGGPLMRLKEWIAHYSLPKSIHFTVFKEQRRMNTLLIKATLALVLLLGSAGGAAVASADSLPGRPLYPVKIIVEDTWLALTANPVNQSALHLNFARERLKEIKQLALDGDTVPEATLVRFQLHLNQTLHLAAQAPDETMFGLLTQIRQMAQNQEQTLAQTQAQVTQPSQESLHQAGIALKQVGQQAEIGLQEPQTFRHRWQHAEGGNPEPPCDGANCDPQHNRNQNQHQNQNQLSDPPGNSCTGDDCPGAPVRNQNQSQNQLSEPPGEPCTGDNCPGAPVQNQNQNQHQNHYQLSEPPGESCTGDDCLGEPVQNQNQNQYQNQYQLSGQPRAPCSGDDCPGTPVQSQNQNQHQGLDQEEIRDRERARIQEQGQDGAPAGPGDNGNGGSDNGGNPDNDGNPDNGGNDTPPSGNGGSDGNGGNPDNGGSDNAADSGSDGSNDNGNGGSGNNGGGNGGGGNGGGGGNK